MGYDRSAATKAGIRGELTELRKQLVDLCRNGVPTLAELAAKTDTSVGTVAGAISVLRMRGLVPTAKRPRTVKRSTQTVRQMNELR